MTAILKCINGWCVCCSATCNPRYTSKQSLTVPMKELHSIQIKESTTNATNTSKGISTRWKTGRHHPNSSQQNEVTLLVFLPSPLAKSFPTTMSGPQSVRRFMLHANPLLMLHAKSSPSSSTTTEWAAVHRNRVPTFSSRGDKARWLPAKKIVVQNVSRNT